MTDLYKLAEQAAMQPGGAAHAALEDAIRAQAKREERLQAFGMQDTAVGRANDWAGRQLAARKAFGENVKDQALGGMASKGLSSMGASL